MATKEKKAQTIGELQDVLAKTSIGIVADYRGLTAADTTALRRKLREAKVEFRIIKNTLARRAAVQAGREDVAGLFKGPMAMITGYGDISQPARVLLDHVRSTRSNLSVKGGFLGSQVLSAADVTTLTTLPSKEVLLARVLGGIQSPITSFVSVLAAPIRGVLGVLQARIQQLEGK